MQFLRTADAICLKDCRTESIWEIVILSSNDKCVFLMMISSNRIPRHDRKNHTKSVILNATFWILKVNATGNGYGGCIYFGNSRISKKIKKVIKSTCIFFEDAI